MVELVAHLHSLEGLHEAILVDAGNQPESKSIAAESIQAVQHSASIRYISSNQAGRGLQMNLGAKYARGEILVFLHCDTRLPVDAMNLIRQSIGRGKDWGRFDLSVDAKGLIYRLIERMINLRSRIRPIATGDQALFVTTGLFKKCGGYPQIALMEDIAICKRFNRYSRPGLITENVMTSARRWRNVGALKTIWLMWKLRLLFWLGVDATRLARMYGNER